MSNKDLIVRQLGRTEILTILVEFLGIADEWAGLPPEK